MSADRKTIGVLFLGFLLGLLVSIAATISPQEAALSLRYVERGVDPHIQIVVRQVDDPHTYYLSLQLFSNGDIYDVPCSIERIED